MDKFFTHMAAFYLLALERLFPREDMPCHVHGQTRRTRQYQVEGVLNLEGLT